MELKILDFVKDMKDSSKVYGYLQIQMKDSFKCWLTVLKNEKNGYFFRYPSSFIEGKFIPSFEFTKMDFPRLAYEQLKEEFKINFG